MERTLSLIGSKWTLLILREFLDGTKRFGQLKKSLPGISPKTLSQRLQELEKEGILTKKIYPEVPPRVEYSLTPRGERLKSILLDLVNWGLE
ncbi:MAG TPA: helix-turn-helix domain-containing protein [Anaerolineae bacterium]|nr:helix-turn-helix domain-containing protein [Anaerolineae bacterium]